MADENKPHRLEDLKNRLFSKSFRNRLERREGFSPRAFKKVADSWDISEKGYAAGSTFFMKTSLFKKIFLVSMAFFALCLIYASYMFFFGGNTVSNDNIEIKVTGNNFTAGGEELELIVSIANHNSASLDLVDLVVEYPQGTEEDPTDIERLRESLGTIPAGAVRNENVKLVLFGEQGSIRPIRITLEYRVAGSNAIFVKEKMYNVNINSTPINLSIEAPQGVSPDQNITLNVKAGLNATRPAEDILIKLDYPPGFQFIKSVPEPAYGDNIWYVGDLSPGALYGISIEGKMTGVFDGEEKTFLASSGTQASGDKTDIDVVFNSIRHIMKTQKAFIDTNVFINGVAGREYAVDSSTDLNVEIRYANNLSTRIDDLVIRAKISGNAWDRGTVRPVQGHYDSSQNTVTWDKSSKSALAEVNPGSSGSVNFSFEPLSTQSGALLDPRIDLAVDISGRQSAEDASINELKNSASATIRVVSGIGFSAKALYYSGPFTNTGPIPPKAEKTTTYTIVWNLGSTANNISRAQLSSSLPAWVNFTGKVLPQGEDLTYNASTRKIIWNIGRIERNATTSRSVSFQVELKPSLSQVGSTPLIINDSVLTGHDDFANVDLKSTKDGLSTTLENDPAFPEDGSIVVN